MSETRALTAALSGPVFDGAASRSALHASERHMERWVPEGAKATRSGGLRSLGFADRVAAPWMNAAMQSRGAQMMARPTSDRSTPEVSWLFPRPWFQDELDWMSAARVRSEQSPQFLTTRGTYESTRSAPSDVAMPMVSPQMVAPSMATYGMPPGFSNNERDAGYGQVHHGLRSYSPMVPFAAAAAAEVVAGTIGLAQQSGLTAIAGAAGRSPILSALTMVAPAAFAPTRSALPTYDAPASFVPTSTTAPTPASTRAMIDAARAAVTRVDEVRQAPAVTVTEPTAAATVAAPATVAAAPTAPFAGAEPTSVSDDLAGPVADASIRAEQPPAATASSASASAGASNERSIAAAATASPAIARALRGVDLLLQASTPSAAMWPAATTPSATPPAVTPSAAWPVAPSAAATGFEPVVGPRVTMPAGLGGLVMALDAQRTTMQPMARFAGMPTATPPAFAPALRFDAAAGADGARGAGMPATLDRVRETPSFSPVWASPSTALGAIAGDRARAVDHVAWSDRWLARFVGASPVALAALDVSHEHGASASASSFGALGALGGGARSRDVASPEQVYVRPMAASTLATAIRDTAAGQPLDAPTAARAPVAAPVRPGRIDDTQAVSDDIFAAISAAAVAPLAARPLVVPRRDEPTMPTAAAPELRPLTAADVVRAGSRPTLADLVSIAPPPAPGAGLSPGLASSPMAPAMAGMLPLPAAPVFDPRALFPEALSTAYMGGLLSRSAAPIGVVSSTPTMSALISAAGFASSFASPSASFMGPSPSGLLGLPGLPGLGQVGGAADPAAAVGMSMPLPMLPMLPMLSGAMRDARAWSLRDQSVAPTALRLAESAPDRVVLAADEARRAAPSSRQLGEVPPVAPDLAALAALAPVAASAAAELSTGPASLPSLSAAAEAVAVDPATAAQAGDVAQPHPVAPDASASATVQATTPTASIDAELVTLRAALLAAPGPTSMPLAFAEHLPMLSAPMTTTVPIAASAPMISTDLAMPVAATSMAGPIGARGLALPAVGGAMARAEHPGAERHGAERVDGLPGGAFGLRESSGALAALHAPGAYTSTGRPGSLAELILSWSVAEERAVTDLSFDFVAPEMVLAAKVYGLSPAVAAQAARLAVAGPGAIASLATSVDLTFLRGFQQAHAQQQPGGAFAPAAAARAPYGSAAATGLVEPGADAAFSTAFSTAGAASSATAASVSTLAAATGGFDAPAALGGPAVGPARDGGAPGDRFADPETWGTFDGTAAPSMPAVAGSVLSSRRLPRGAFLWPEATVAALGLKALSPDGLAGMPVVALELLAAAAVADLGTWVTAFPTADQATIANVIRGLGGTVPVSAATSGPMSMAASLMGMPVTGGASAGPMTSAATATAAGATATAPGVPGAPGAPGAGLATGSAIDAGDEPPDVPELSAAPRDLRSRFEAIYIALTRTGDGQALSPSVRAARAMAMLARGDGGATSARERALAAWSILPHVYQGDLDVVAPRGDGGADVLTETRPGLAALAARAGESLGSFVAPSRSEVDGWRDGESTADAHEARESRAAARAEAPVYVQNASPSAQAIAQAMARPGRAFAQAGGGEPEIPSWFEAAARRMMEERSPGSGMSLAELVLVTSASTPSKAIAAATRGASSSPASASPMVAAAHGGGKANVEKIAVDVFQEVLKLIDIARERSGDPYQ